MQVKAKACGPVNITIMVAHEPNSSDGPCRLAKLSAIGS
jgi:hypothetical protein